MTDPTAAAEHRVQVSSLTYEQARDELAGLVRTLEAGSAPLEDSLAMWERGEALARHCESILSGALARLDSAAPDAAATDLPAR